MPARSKVVTIWAATATMLVVPLAAGYWLYLAPALSRRTALVAAAPPPAPSASEREIKLLASQIHDGDPKANEVLRAVADKRPRVLARSLPPLLKPLLDAKNYPDVERLTLTAMLVDPQNVASLADEQGARMEALIAQGKYELALDAARSYYNVAPVASTDRAIRCLADCLAHTRAKSDPTITRRFVTQQAAGLRSSQAAGDESALRSIHVDSAIYEPALKATSSSDSYENVIAHGYWLLMADRPTDALKCFTDLCGTDEGLLGGGPETRIPRLRAAIDGAARALRACDGAAAGANALILSLRQTGRGTERLGLFATGSWDPEQIKAIAEQIPILEHPTLPSMVEIAREEEEHQSAQSDVEVTIRGGFEGAPPLSVKKISPTHFQIGLDRFQPQIGTDLRNWFMFRVEGAAGKTVRFDFKGPPVKDWVKDWWSLNPVYTYATDLGAVDTYSSTPIKNSATPQPALNGPLLPDTSGQKWHYISQVWSGDPNGFYFVQKFEQNVAYVAMRAPYLPAYNEAYLKSIAGKNGVQVVTVGQSELGRPLLLVQIGGATATQSKPCILIYGREHGTEADSSFVAQGALDFLISDVPEARDLRSRFVFFIIPLFDVDAAAEGRYENMIFRFSRGMENQEAVAWARFFGDWARKGNRIDVVVDLHNEESAGSPHLMCPTFGARGSACGQLNDAVVRAFRKTIYTVKLKPRYHAPGVLQGRLGGWLERYLGALLIPYEVNSQDSTRHLTIAETRDMGRILVLATTQYLVSHDGTELLGRIDKARAQRAKRWAKYGSQVADMNELEAEIRCEELSAAPPTQPTAGANR